jgi:hypothetical protein
MAAQLPDIIILNEKQMDLFTNPLEQYWISKKKKRPRFCRLISCQRGYIATWEIKDNQLYLNQVEGSYVRRVFFFWRKIARYSIARLFPRSKSSGVMASWFSGKLRIPSGPMLMYEHYGYGSRYEKETIITVDHGKVIKQVMLDFTNHKLTFNAMEN